jgi:gamma-glutamyltranspeptidase / glutathione hydrolase
MNFTTPYTGARAPLLARNVVATSQPLAAQAGLEALRSGGNAVDAALATAITLTVVEPTMNGIGGDGFALVWDGDRLHGMNASGRSPATMSLEMFAGLERIPIAGWKSVTVPGVVSGWVMLSQRFGKLPFEQLFTAAIRYAREGFAVTPVVSRQWDFSIERCGEQPGFANSFLPKGRAPCAGEQWKFPQQAETLEAIAHSKGEAFYRGELMKRIVAYSEETGGFFTEHDFLQHEANWVEPLASDYGGTTLHEIPPNGSGLAAQMALGILDLLGAGAFADLSVDRVHLQVEAMRLAFADIYAHVSDPATMRVNPLRLLDKNYLASRAALIDRTKAGHYRPGDLHSGGTVYLTAADSNGMMVSYIQSNYMGFGSGVVAPGGISLQNRGAGFSLTPGHPNCIGPGKRPFHTIIPGLLTRGGAPVMSFGVMGGNMQPQGHVQMVMRIVNDGLNPQAASDRPRWRIGDDGVLTVEAAMPTETVQGLRERGHEVAVMPADSLDFGSAQAIVRMDLNELDRGYVAGSDHRRDGMAVGF